MAYIDKVLAKIQSHIENKTFEHLETERLEIKDLSGGENWKELYKTASAFLNTEGGIIVIGIKEKNNQYVFTGYKGSPKMEDSLKDIPNQFTNIRNEKLKLKEYFPSWQIKDFLNGYVCVIYVDKLPENEKFAFYEKEAYKRELTGDRKLKKEEILLQEEKKEEARYAEELKIVPNTTLENLEIDKLNEYIIRLNREVKIESLKADIPSALPFLNRKHFVVSDKPTLLGMLVCGEHIYDYMGGRCQIDAFVERNILSIQNKQILKDNILPLMERAIAFIFNNIQVGLSHSNGGSQVPEYPEKLLREILNNALAHRDYSSTDFVNVIIRPNKNIEIKNPGSFRQEQILRLEEGKIRRIIPIAKARNPHLADILKVFDKWEGRGIGMASLTNACLENVINVPYYLLHQGKISLYIPKGRVLDEQSELWLKSFGGYLYQKTNGRTLSEQEKILLTYFYKSEKLNQEERYTILLTADNNHFNVISSLLEKKLIFVHNQSNSLYPIYLIDRVLCEDNFDKELRKIYGGAFDILGNEQKEVLNAIYQHALYGEKTASISANSMAKYLYLKRNILVSNVQDYENYKRKVRTIFNKLTQNEYILKNEMFKNAVILNKDFERTPSIFDEK